MVCCIGVRELGGEVVGWGKQEGQGGRRTFCPLVT